MCFMILETFIYMLSKRRSHPDCMSLHMCMCISRPRCRYSCLEHLLGRGGEEERKDWTLVNSEKTIFLMVLLIVVRPGPRVGSQGIDSRDLPLCNLQSSCSRILVIRIMQSFFATRCHSDGLFPLLSNCSSKHHIAQVSLSDLLPCFGNGGVRTLSKTRS